MIIVLGSIVAKPDSLDELRRLSLEHVGRSRNEPGCVAHMVHVDSEDPMRLVFVEKWADAAALGAHFKVKELIAFVARARELAASAPTIEIFEAAAAKIG